MSTYNGPATLTLTNDQQLAGHATLNSRRNQHGLGSWDGRFQPSETGADIMNALGANLTMTLPDGKTGEVIVTNTDMLAPRPIFELTGSGEAPF
jgi:hypothetical protein